MASALCQVRTTMVLHPVNIKVSLTCARARNKSKHCSKLIRCRIMERSFTWFCETSVKKKRNSMSLKIMLVDDHEVVRIGLATLLGRHPGFVIVGEAANAPQAIAKVDELKPD